MFRSLVIFLLFCPVMIAAMAAEDVRTNSAHGFRDLTESGAGLDFHETGPSEAVLSFLEDPRTHRPVFEIRGLVGDQIVITCSGLAPGWTARAWTGPGAWRAIPVRASVFGQELRLVFQRSRELIELFPPDCNRSRASGYSYNDFLNYVGSLPVDPRLTVSVIGNSVMDRPIYKVLFDDLDARMPPSMKRTVVIFIRQHGDEWPPGFILEGMLDYLLGLNGWQPDAEVTDEVRWIIYPLVNPDGAFLDQRYNANGVDLNRDWSGNGPQSWQQPETNFIQSDLASSPYQDSIRVFGDHHGWWSYGDGGYRYDDGGYPALVTHAAYLEAVKDTHRYTAYEPMVFDWYENGGQDGMARVELYRWKGWLGHTPEYYSGTRDENDLRTAGARYMQAMRDTVYALDIDVPTVKIGSSVPFFVDEDDQNLSPVVAETIEVIVGDWVTGDRERVTLVETGLDSGEFTLSPGLPTSGGTMIRFDGILQTVPGSYAVGYYKDPDLVNDQCFAGTRIVP